MDTIIRPLTPAQIPVLLEMIRELARFEKLEHEVEATPESLREAFFGSQPNAGALVADADGKTAGYAIYFFTFCSFAGRRGLWLEDVFVRPEFRKRGLGRRLIESVAAIGAENNCARYEWTALNWNENALKFYDGLGAERMSEWLLLRMNHQQMRRLAGRG